MNDQATTLESRIASALVATDITSTDLSQLLVEVEAAAAAADADADRDSRAGARSCGRDRCGNRWCCCDDRHSDA